MKGVRIMDHLNDRIAYLQGLADGIDFKNKKVELFMDELLDVITELHYDMLELKAANRAEIPVVDSVNDLPTDYNMTSPYDVYLGEPEGLEDVDLEEEEVLYDVTYDDDETGYFDVECPNCQDLILVSNDVFDDDMVTEVICPECDEVIVFNDDDDTDYFADTHIVAAYDHEYQDESLYRQL